MTDDQATRLLSVVDRLARAMPVSPPVCELRNLVVRKILGARTVAKAPPLRKPAARAKPKGTASRA